MAEIIQKTSKKTIYREGKTLVKLFNSEYPKSDVLNEALNTARVEVVDEAALMAKMEACPAFTFAADVAPKTAADFVAKFGERCAFSKIKMGAQTEEANTNCGCAGVNQIVAFFDKGDCTFQVNKAK